MISSPSGFLLIDKPAEWTSHDVVAFLRGVTKVKKIGHAGTLDPFATGLLIVAVGRDATKRLDEFKALQKEYVATVQLGATSDTQDRTGTIVPNISADISKLSDRQIQDVLFSFVGDIFQTPPMYSAKKVGGKKLYELARKGIETERKPVQVHIFELELLAFDAAAGTLNIRVVCSAGTYIRTLAADIGEKLGVGAYCAELRRTKIGAYSVEDALVPKALSRESSQERLL